MSNPKEQMQRASELARIDLTEAQAQALAPEFATILNAFRGLAEVDVEGVPPTLGATLLEDIKRLDIPKPATASARLLAGAPESRDGSFLVPKAIGGQK